MVATAHAADPALPRETPDLGDSATRAALSNGAFKAFVYTADFLNLSVADRCRLLGDIPQSTYYRWKDRGAEKLDRDRLERISLVLGITKGLRLLFSEDADGIRWLKAENADAPFGGRSPLGKMLNGSIADLHAVRGYIDAWRGVWP